MIISHKYKYLFVELPRTGSTAISKELQQNYDGSPILYKHATYSEFKKIATAEEKKYFVFSCIRNPLDDAVSLYYKYRTDHHEQFTWMQQNKNLFTRLVLYPTLSRFNFVKRTNADFSTYFLKFYRVPFSNWSMVEHERFDFVIRFENLQDDFAEALKLMGIEQKKPLPVANKTEGKGDPFSHYTPEAIKRAKKVFGPFMEKWNYEFPPEWGEVSITWSDRMAFEFFNSFRNFYWRYLRSHVYAGLRLERGNKLAEAQN